MIIDKNVNIKINNYCIKHYKNLGYDVKEYDEITIPIEHLMQSSHQMIHVKCDICGKEKKIQYRRYLLSFNNGGYYCCSNCKKGKIDKKIKDIYGVDNIFQNYEIKNNIKKKNVEKYGDESFIRSSFKEFILNKYSTLNIIEVDYEKGEYVLKCDKCGTIYRINKKNFMSRIKYKTILCTICNPINRHVSGYEIQLQDFIKNNYDGEIIFNSRKIIPPLELDIYIPELQVAFEFNGTYWHNDNFKNLNYHDNKSNRCKENNIKLLHVWEKDWRYNIDEIKSIILKHLNNEKIKI